MLVEVPLSEVFTHPIGAPGQAGLAARKEAEARESCMEHAFRYLRTVRILNAYRDTFYCERCLQYTHRDTPVGTDE